MQRDVISRALVITLSRTVTPPLGKDFMTWPTKPRPNPEVCYNVTKVETQRSIDSNWSSSSIGMWQMYMQYSLVHCPDYETFQLILCFIKLLQQFKIYDHLGWNQFNLVILIFSWLKPGVPTSGPLQYIDSYSCSCTSNNIVEKCLYCRLYYESVISLVESLQSISYIFSNNRNTLIF